MNNKRKTFLQLHTENVANSNNETARNVSEMGS